MKQLLLIGLLAVLFIVTGREAHAQFTEIEAPPVAGIVAKNAIYGEAGTNIIITGLTLNVERHFASSASGKLHWYGRYGGGLGAVFYGPAGFGGLAGVTMLTGQRAHHLEAGLGLFVGIDTGMGMGSGAFALPVADLGYRFQRPEGGLVFRAKAGALGFGLGLGYAF